MYRFIIRRQIRAAFRALSRGDAPALLAHMSPDVHHTFPATPMKPCRSRIGWNRRSPGRIISLVVTTRSLLPAERDLDFGQTGIARHRRRANLLVRSANRHEMVERVVARQRLDGGAGRRSGRRRSRVRCARSSWLPRRRSGCASHSSTSSSQVGTGGTYISGSLPGRIQGRDDAAAYRRATRSHGPTWRNFVRRMPATGSVPATPTPTPSGCTPS